MSHANFGQALKIDKTQRPQAFKPVVVHWVDSMAQPGWGDYVRDTSLVCVTVGHLVERTDAHIVVALSRNGYQHADYITIPRSAVKSVKQLRADG